MLVKQFVECNIILLDLNDVMQFGNWTGSLYIPEDKPHYTQFKVCNSDVEFSRMRHFGRLLLNASDELQVDHINRNSLDYRRANLRLATQSQNLYNQGLRKDSTTKYRGVSVVKSTGLYRAYISVEGQQIYLGSFVTPEEAAKARDAAAKKYHKEFAYLNFPD